MDDIQSLFSSLEGPNTPFSCASSSDSFISPSFISPPPPCFRPQASSLLAMYLPHSAIDNTSAMPAKSPFDQLNLLSIPGPVSQATPVEQLDQTTASGLVSPAKPTASFQAISHDQPNTVTKPYPAEPTSHIQCMPPDPAIHVAMINQGFEASYSSAAQSISAAFKPVKTAEQVFAKYTSYVNKEKIGFVAVKLAKNTYFGTEVLAVSTVKGTKTMRALDKQKL